VTGLPGWSNSPDKKMAANQSDSGLDGIATSSFVGTYCEFEATLRFR
jgi:hypothetical protein